MERKGVSPVLSSIMIVAILAIVIGYALKWGMPIMQKNIALSKLKESELIFTKIHDKIEGVVKVGGSEEIVLQVDGKMIVDPKNDSITLRLVSEGTIYGTGFTCFTENCEEEGTLGEDDFAIYGVETHAFGNRFLHIYILKMRNLTSNEGKKYRVDLLSVIGNEISDERKLYGNKGDKIVIMNLGVEEVGNVTKEKVGIMIS